AHRFVLRRLLVRVLHEVKTPHLVRAVVGAEPRADATVVYLHVQAFRIVHGRVHRTDQFARRVLAHHARHRLAQHRRSLGIAFVIMIHANPVHFAAAVHLILADHGDVVFGLARDRARLAANAGIEIDAHTPRVFAFWVIGIERWWLFAIFVV